MRRSLWWSVLAAGLAVLGVYAWGLLFPNQEALLRHRLKEMASLASFGPNEGALARAFNAQKLSALCTPDVEIVLGTPGYQQTINGRDEVLGGVMRARGALSSLQLEFPDILISVAPDKQSAVAEVTARTRIGGEKDADVRELRCSFKKLDGSWLLSRVEGVRTLRK
jgi:hypothetical protein